MRASMVDVTMEKENGDHMSLTGLGLALNHVGFASGGSMGTPDVSSQSLNPTGLLYPSYFLSPVSARSRSSDLFDRQNSEVLPYQRQHVQPLQLRETISSGTKSLQPTLSMSWEGGTTAQNMIVVGCLALEFHREMVKEDLDLGPVGEDGRATCWGRRGDGKEPPLESRELEERTAVEVRVLGGILKRLSIYEGTPSNIKGFDYDYIARINIKDLKDKVLSPNADYPMWTDIIHECSAGGPGELRVASAIRRTPNTSPVMSDIFNIDREQLGFPLGALMGLKR
ncbi:hypothetical protein DL95DRAFT_417716 [Leptodontidium sp. 2 PMI_412]|nr:hypothetical protein DL95DRAFT_417716 [Leptodontidium sp. 2 PMI_412]